MSTRVGQRGATLLVGLVMLVLLTLLAVSAIRSSTINLRIAGNMQMQNEARAAAQQAIEQVISSNFTAAPVATTVAVDANGDGTSDYSAAVAVPTCTASVAIDNLELDPTVPSDRTCISSTQANGQLILQADGKPIPGPSWCFTQNWQVRASVNDPSTGAAATVTQGVKVRVPAGTVC